MQREIGRRPCITRVILDRPARRKWTKAEALAEGIGATTGKIDEIDFLPSFTAEDRAMLIESMNAHERYPGGGHHPGGGEQEKPE